MSEVRVTNEKTGGQKGAKPQAMGLLPLDILMKEVAPLYHFGAEKYAPENWRRGFDWRLSADALLRHFSQFWGGEDYDEESGCKHLASVVFHACALMYFMEEHPDLDDRPHRIAERASTEGDDYTLVYDGCSRLHADGTPREATLTGRFYPPVSSDVDFLESIAPEDEEAQGAGMCLEDAAPVRIPVTRPQREEFWRDAARKCGCPKGLECVGCPKGWTA